MNDQKIVAEMMGIDAEELLLRKTYLKLDSNAIQILKDLHGRMESYSSTEFIDNFYNTLLSFKHTRSLLPDENVISRLRDAQKRYFSELTMGVYEQEYLMNRLRVGLIHQKVGLEPKWYIGAYCEYLGGIIKNILDDYADRSESASTAIHSLLKIVFLDMSLALDAYFYANIEETNRFRAYASQIMASIRNGIVAVRRDNTILVVNPSFSEIVKQQQGELIGHDLMNVLPVAELYGHIESVFSSDSVVENITIQLRTENKKLSYIVSFTPMCLGSEDAVLLVLENISEAVELRENVAVSEKKMRLLAEAVEQTTDVVIITDLWGIITFVNPSFENITGYTLDEAVGKTPALVKSGKHGSEFYKRMWVEIGQGNTYSEVFINRKKSGELYYEEKSITPILDSAGVITNFVSTGKDITERMQVQEQFHYLAYHDALTDLPNRLLLMDRLKQALSRARWHKRIVSLLFIDIDRFKIINDTLGHEAGDQVLKRIANRFLLATRDGDTVARFGGDEFGILLDDMACVEDIAQIAEKILEELMRPIYVESQEFFISGSIGISCFPNDGVDHISLLKNADVAMYRAKELGKNTYQFYSADMSKQALERLNMETRLRSALERDEFILFYQPQLDTQLNKIVSVEALLRWQHPELGMIPPLKFVPMLEETGLIIPVGEWIIRTAANQCRKWLNNRLGIERVSVNLSSYQFSDPDMTSILESAITSVSLPAGSFEVEITESMLMDDSDDVTNKLYKLKSLGVRAAIDDFGTGYSSLSYLKRFPLDVLKIDRSFIMDVPADADSKSITCAIVQLAHALELDVIAEGVETDEQLAFLKSLNCRYIQGFKISKPVPASKLAMILNGDLESNM